MNTKKIDLFRFLGGALLLCFGALCIAPFWLVLVNSFAAETDIATHGYSIWPRTFDLTAYRVLLADSGRVLHAYWVTIRATVIGSALAIAVTAMAAYPLSQDRVKYRKIMNIYVLLTMLFSGGMVSWFIVCRNIFHLKDNLWALILPYLANAWYIFLVRNYYRSIPGEIVESAKIDGAGETYIFTKLILPLSKPVLATIALFISLAYWNDWWLGLMLIDDANKQPLQLLLRTITSNIQFLQSSPNANAIAQIASSIPSEGIKMATCIVTVGPIILVYPVVQKFFVKGIMVGSVKG